MLTRIAVGRRAHRAADAERAAGAGDILDQDRLPERLPHALAEHARQRIGRPAGGEWHDDGDRFRWIVLRTGGRDAMASIAAATRG